MPSVGWKRHSGGQMPITRRKSIITIRCHLLMTSHYPLGPGVSLQPGETFKSFRTFEILHDSDDRERKGLARRKMYRTVAPQVTENPILMHVRSAEPDAVRLAIDQCAEVGFEMVIMTFGSGFNVESEDSEYIATMKDLSRLCTSAKVFNSVVIR